jgi:SAM-dependent methyltransferase
VPIRQSFLAGLSAQLGHPTGIRGRLVARALNRGNRSATAAAVEALGLAQGERAMDVGFGGGVGIGLLLDQLNGSGHVTGVDISETMIRAAQRRFSAQISQGRVTLIEGEAEHLSVRDGSVDALLTVNTLYFVDDLPAAMREFRRVLSPGARAVFGVGDQEAMKDMPFTSHGFRLRPTGEITSVAEANGFEISRHERVGQGPRAFHLLIARPRVIPLSSDQPATGGSA